MSGPLASWTQVHVKASPPAKAVLVTIALRKTHPDGTGPDHSRERLAELTGYGLATVKRALRELVDEAQVLEELEPGGGRVPGRGKHGRVTRYRVRYWFCPEPPPGKRPCLSCQALAKAIEQERRRAEVKAPPEKQGAQSEPVKGAQSEPVSAPKGLRVSPSTLVSSTATGDDPFGADVVGARAPQTLDGSEDRQPIGTNELDPPWLPAWVERQARRIGREQGPDRERRYREAVAADQVGRAMAAERDRLQSGDSPPEYRPFLPKWAEGGPPVGGQLDQEAAS